MSAGVVLNNSAQLTLNTASGFTETFLGVISNGTGSSGSLVKAGAGTQVLVGANTYSGGTTIQSGGGTLQLGNGASGGLSLGSGSIIDNGVLAICPGSSGVTVSNTISGGGSVTANGFGTVTLSASSNTYSNGTTITSGVLAVAGSGALGSGTVTINGGARGHSHLHPLAARLAGKRGGTVEGIPSGTLTLSGNLGGTGGLTVGTVGSSGGCTVSLSGGTVNYQGNTTINAATLNAHTALPNGTRVYIGAGATEQLVLNASQTIGGLSGGGTAASVILNNSAQLTLNTLSGFSGVFAGSINNGAGSTGSLVKTGVGTQTFTGANAYTGGTNIQTNGGTLQLGNGSSGSPSLGSGGIVDNSVLAFCPGSSGFTVSNIISGGGSATVTSASRGTVTLTAASTYTSATTVYAGTLCVNGSITGAVTVSGGTLCGTGTTGAVTNSSGYVVPGGLSTVGTLNTGSLGLSGGSNFDVVLASSGGGTSSSLINVTGATSTVTISTSAYLSPTVNFTTTPAPGTVFVLIANGGNSPVSGHFYNEPEGSARTLGGVTFYITYCYNYVPGGTSTFNNGNSVALVVSTPPTAANENYMTVQGQPITGNNIVANDVLNNHENGLTLSVAQVSVTAGGNTTPYQIQSGGTNITTAAGGALTAYSSGAFTYTPPSSFLGYDGLNTSTNENTYVITDGVQPSSPETLQFIVEAAPIFATGTTIPSAGGQSTFNVATFTQQGNAGNPSSYTAEINWGDGTVDTGGQITANGQGYAVSASHDYTFSSDYYTVTVTISDNRSGSSQATTVTSTVTNQLFWNATSNASNSSNPLDWASGTWNVGSASGPPQPGWVPGCDAIFPTGPATVPVIGSVSVGTIEFQSSGVVVGSPTSTGTLSFTNGQITVDQAGASDTLAANVAAGTLTKLGQGELIFDDNNGSGTFSGAIDVQAGTVDLESPLSTLSGTLNVAAGASRRRVLFECQRPADR